MLKLQKEARFSRLTEHAVNALAFGEVEGPFKKKRVPSIDLRDAVYKGRVWGFLKHPNPGLRLDPALVAEKFIQNALEEIIEDATFMPEEAFMFVELYLGGVGQEGRRTFTAHLLKGTAVLKEHTLPISVFKHLALKCRLQYTPAEQRTLLDWARDEDTRNAASAANVEEARIQSNAYSNERALKKVLSQTQEH